MANYKLLLILGFVTLFVPFLGIPEIFRNWIVAISSLLLISYAFFVRSLVRKDNFNHNESVYIDSNKIDSDSNSNQDMSENNMSIEDEKQITTKTPEKLIEEGEDFEEEVTRREDE